MRSKRSDSRSTSGSPRYLTLLLVGVLGACSAIRTPLPTYPTNPDASPAGVLIDGKLEVSSTAACLEIRSTGYPPIALEWPPGYSVTLDPLKVYGPTGAEVASAGVEVSLSGSLVSTPDPRCGTTSTLWVIGVGKTNDAN